MEEKVTIYHNPRCSKSRGALEILTDDDVPYVLIPYIDSPPSESQLKEIMAILGVEPREMIHEGTLKKLGFDIADYDSSVKVLALLLQHPEAMNRPICIRGEHGLIARPPERVREIYP